MMNQELDDLTKITGIGPKVQNRLRTSLQVKTYADLGALPPEKIESTLNTDKSIMAPLKTREKIEHWLSEAQSLSETSNQPGLKTEDSWEPIDSFVLELQSRQNKKNGFDVRIVMQHVEHDANNSWDFRNNEERENIFSWMEKEANLNQLLKPPTKTQNEQPETVEEIAVLPKTKDMEIAQILVTQGKEETRVAIDDELERPFLGHVHHELPLDLEVTFVVPFMPTTGDNTLKYKAQCQFNNLSQGNKSTYLDMGTTKLVGDQPGISAKLSEITLQPGIYDLGILISGERPLGATYYEFPKLNVL